MLEPGPTHQAAKGGGLSPKQSASPLFVDRDCSSIGRETPLAAGQEIPQARISVWTIRPTRPRNPLRVGGLRSYRRVHSIPTALRSALMDKSSWHQFAPDNPPA